MTRPPASDTPRVGAELPRRTVQMSLAKARLFSLPNESFHTHDEKAVQIGLKMAAPQGLMSYGYLSQAATDYFGPSWVCDGELNISFVNLLTREDLLTIGGEVADVRREGDRLRIVLALWIDNDRGEKVAVGQAIGYRPAL